MRMAIALAVLTGLGSAAFAQSTTTPTTPSPSTTAAQPTRDQCQAGYKADYKQWTKAQFDQACAGLMKK